MPRAPKRPKNVPADAIFNDDEWSVGPLRRGKKHGLWRIWHPDGVLFEEAHFDDGVLHGELRSYHDDGTLFQHSFFDRGRPTRVTNFRSKKKSRAPAFFENLTKHVVRFEAEVDLDGWTVSQRFYDAQGAEIDLQGNVRVRPRNIPKDAYLAGGTYWRVGRFKSEENRGLHRFYDDKGKLCVVQYLDGGQSLATIDFAEKTSYGSLTVEAARKDDEDALSFLFDNGIHCTEADALHAAFEGLFDLAARLVRRPPVAPPKFEAALPKRPPMVPPKAVWVRSLWSWVLGDWDRATGKGRGSFAKWRTFSDEPLRILNRTEVDFERGVRRRVATFNGRTGKLEREVLHDARGAVVKQTVVHDYGDDEHGALTAVEELKDGRVFVGERYTSGKVLWERESLPEGGAFVCERHYDDEGRVRLELTPHPKEARERAVMFDEAGAKFADGLAFPRKRGDSDESDDDDGDANGLLAGDWSFEGRDGKSWKFDVDPWRLERSATSAALLEPLARSLKSPKPKWVETKSSSWNRLEGFHGSLAPTEVPAYLHALAGGNIDVAAFVLTRLSDEIYHQHTLTSLSGPTLAHMTTIAAAHRDGSVQTAVLELLVEVASRGHSIDSANAMKQALRTAKSKATSALTSAFRKHRFEPEFGQFFGAILEASARWVELARDESVGLRRVALALSSLCEDDETLDALLAATHLGTDALTRAQALIGLALRLPPREKATRAKTTAALERALNDANPLVRYASALTWIRRQEQPDEPAVRVLLDALGDPAPIAAVIDESAAPLFWLDIEGDAASTLTLVPREALEGALGALLKVLASGDASNTLGVARALLASTFADKTEREFDEDEDDNDEERVALTPSQRKVLTAIASSNRFWAASVNAAEVLEAYGLPSSRKALRAALAGKALATDAGGTRTLTAIGGLAVPSVASFRRSTRT